MEIIDFELKDEYIELNKLLKFTGVCDTGGDAKMSIDQGLVKYNNQVETQRRKKVRKGDTIQFQQYQIEIR
ncbi:MAG: RNA-binding S4 domain-containing protein [Flavobacteriales bacterium]|nr:RNA-binding S4 domain-containing protein [Flavobacteriales bacterium]MCW8913655.1 RNA-binding S4 domain-containing protein [Flavobacteriales bacterium]MCW8937159.1 RNA-binding S4 domain-containing protein [Flavobacteriales bacterium]MCW8968669.1 RNA-binding S4 domain-containing protein [Flavobacteriales bacterium]MCW8991494.1 RNA-binding S4 domain-containing protein [Flavobacteriales bacterium]